MRRPPDATTPLLHSASVEMTSTSLRNQQTLMYGSAASPPRPLVLDYRVSEYAPTELEDHLQRQKAHELRHIESEIRDTKDFFVEVDRIVRDQQPALDQVEASAAAASTKAEKAVRELEEAHHLLIRSRYRTCFLTSIIVVVASVIVVIAFALEKK